MKGYETAKNIAHATGPRHTIVLALIALFLAATLLSLPPALSAQTSTQPAGDDPRYQSDFTIDEDGWIGAFADYPIYILPEEWEMEFGYEPLPASLNVDANGLMLQGDNHSDDLFMYVKRPYDGLLPNTTYQVLFQVDLASNAPTGWAGGGGSPGDSVFVKVGVSLTEPNAIVGDNDHWRMNIDKGNQSTSGEDAIVVGTVGVELPGVGGVPIYKIKPLDNVAELLFVTTDDRGQVWLLVGTDSGFEALTRIYLADITVEFAPVWEVG